jgi:hypothetical protein
MITRNDAHSPLNLVTEDYAYVGGFDNEGPTFGTARSDLRTLLARSTTARYGDGGQCDHCGARIRYVAVLRHAPTGDHIAVGETCLGNRFALATADFHRMRKAAELDRAEHKILTAWNAYRTEHPTDWAALDASENGFVRNVLAKGRRYGNLSDRQFEAIVTAVARDATRAAEIAARPVEILANVPTGTVTIEGEILTTKWQESQYGSTLKMLVKVETDGGAFKVWGTVPASLHGTWDTLSGAYVGEASRGDVVSFTATVTRSNDDASFGFFKRPRAARIVKVAPGE